MSVETAILDALNGHLAALSFSPAIPIAWPNMSFTPPSADGAALPWLRPTLLRGSPSVLSTSPGNNLYPGLYQVDAFHPIGAGETAPTTTASAIAAHFARGTSIEAGDYTVRVMSPPALLPLQYEDEYVMLPVRVTWRSYAR